MYFNSRSLAASPPAAAAGGPAAAVRTCNKDQQRVRPPGAAGPILPNIRIRGLRYVVTNVAAHTMCNERPLITSKPVRFLCSAYTYKESCCDGTERCQAREPTRASRFPRGNDGFDLSPPLTRSQHDAAAWKHFLDSIERRFHADPAMQRMLPPWSFEANRLYPKSFKRRVVEALLCLHRVLHLHGDARQMFLDAVFTSASSDIRPGCRDSDFAIMFNFGGTEHPSLPYDGFKFRRFSTKMTFYAPWEATPPGNLALPYVFEVYRIAVVRCFGYDRVTKWAKHRDNQSKVYSWSEVFDAHHL